MWPLLVAGVYLPRAERNREIDYSLLVEGQTHIISILEIDPQRTNSADPNRVAGEFAYGNAVDQVANRCSILASNWNCGTGKTVIVSGKKRQDARVKLSDVSIVQAANFLSIIQSNWVNLTCEKMELTKKKGMPDQWDVDFSFVYYY
jgi:hypothetical protein